MDYGLAKKIFQRHPQHLLKIFAQLNGPDIAILKKDIDRTVFKEALE
jgi:hypothetical protein